MMTIDSARRRGGARSRVVISFAFALCWLATSCGPSESFDQTANETPPSEAAAPPDRYSGPILVDDKGKADQTHPIIVENSSVACPTFATAKAGLIDANSIDEAKKPCVLLPPWRMVGETLFAKIIDETHASDNVYRVDVTFPDQNTEQYWVLATSLKYGDGHENERAADAPPFFPNAQQSAAWVLIDREGKVGTQNPITLDASSTACADYDSAAQALLRGESGAGACVETGEDDLPARVLDGSHARYNRLVQVFVTGSDGASSSVWVMLDRLHYR